MNYLRRKLFLLLSVVFIITLMEGVTNVNADDVTGDIKNVSMSEDGVITWESDATCYYVEIITVEGGQLKFYADEVYGPHFHLNYLPIEYADINEIIIESYKGSISDAEKLSVYRFYMKYDDSGATPVYTVIQPTGKIINPMLSKDGTLSWSSDVFWYYTESDRYVSWPFIISNINAQHTIIYDFDSETGDVIKYTLYTTSEPSVYSSYLDQYSFYAKKTVTGEGDTYSIVEPIDSLNVDITLPNVETDVTEVNGVSQPLPDVNVDNEHIASKNCKLITALPSEAQNGYDSPYEGRIEDGEFYYVEIELKAADGYFFNSGIAVNGNGEQYEIADANVQKRNSNIVIYAKVMASGVNRSTLSFEGTVEDIPSVTGNVGDYVELPKVTKDGYIFSKWVVVDSNGKEIAGIQSYSEGAIYTFGTEDCILKAVWEANVSDVVSGVDDTPDTGDVQSVVNDVNATPNTGDTSAVYLLLLLMSVSLASVIVSFKKIRVDTNNR